LYWVAEFGGLVRIKNTALPNLDIRGSGMLFAAGAAITNSSAADAGSVLADVPTFDLPLMYHSNSTVPEQQIRDSWAAIGGVVASFLVGISGRTFAIVRTRTVCTSRTRLYIIDNVQVVASETNFVQQERVHQWPLLLGGLGLTALVCLGTCVGLECCRRINAQAAERQQQALIRMQASKQAQGTAMIGSSCSNVSALFDAYGSQKK
jgi:hypothetical protein